jgi:hypothetical protein
MRVVYNSRERQDLQFHKYPLENFSRLIDIPLDAGSVTVLRTGRKMAVAVMPNTRWSEKTPNREPERTPS